MIAGIRRSDFSRELCMFATKVAPTYNRKILCVLCASVEKFLIIRSIAELAPHVPHDDVNPRP